MNTRQRVFLTRRKYNQWVANETLEDFALRFTAKHARKWSGARIANTALGIVSFLALEAIGGAITLQYGFTNSMWAIIIVCSLIFLSGLPICYYAAKSGLDIDLLTRGAGFGYIGSTISSLVYASFTFIFFALEAAIMSMALQLLFDIPISLAYVISALVVIPLVTHGITRISQFQLWTQPIWVLLQIAPLIFILYHHGDALTTWTHFTGAQENNNDGFNLFLFGAAAAVIFPLIAQNGEQVDYLRFLPDEKNKSRKWWLSLILAGPGWSIVGLFKLFIGSFLAVLALQHGVARELADDPAHMYQVAFSYITSNPDFALVLAGIFVIISQLKINVTNAYAGSIAWSNFFSRLTHDHPGRIVWLFFNVAIALLLMELGLYQAFENILIFYSALVLAWIGSLVADLVINMQLKLRPQTIEFKRGHLYDINPVGVVSMLIASSLGISGQMGLFGETFKALSPFVALFTPFITAPLIAYITRGKYYLARENDLKQSDSNSKTHCQVCENAFDNEDMSNCPAYDGPICSLCCALDASCHDLCRQSAHMKAQSFDFLSFIFPKRVVRALHSAVGHFLVILLVTSTLIAALLTLVFLSVDHTTPKIAEIVEHALWQAFFLLIIVTGVLIWLYVLAENSKRKAYEESQNQNSLLTREVNAHEKTAQELQLAKEAAVTANHAKSRYLSGVSHELRTPLNSIYGYSQLLEKDDSLPPKNKKAAEAIRRNSEYLADVIEGLLEISKIEARRLDIHRDQVKIATVIEQLLEVFHSQAIAKGISFDYECSSQLPTYVAVDEKRLRQILMNLLSNAVKFTRKGGVSLKLTYRNEVATFVVSDTGVGIKPEDQERIFDPFERVRNKEHQFISGTGLGLSISKLLSSMMGGEIVVNSEYGKGSEFIFRIMLPTVQDPKAVQIEKKRINGYQESTKTILIVDDEPYHRGFVIDLLSPLGFNILQAFDSENGLLIASENKIDLFLLDVSLPDIDGWELAAKLKNLYNKTPIIMLSANAIEDHRAEMTSQLHDQYLIKPVRLEVLLEKIGFSLNLNWNYAGNIFPNRANEQTISSKTTNDEYKQIKRKTKSFPSQKDLNELVSLAQIGYLDGVTEKLEQFEKKYDASSFIQYLKSRADICDFDGLIQTIKGLGKS